MSADPLAVHAPGEADLNLYAYVSGHVLKSIDPLGLEETASASFEPTMSTDAGAVSDGTNTLHTISEIDVVGSVPGSHASEPIPQRAVPTADQINDNGSACMRSDPIPGALERNADTAKAVGTVIAGLTEPAATVMDVETLVDPDASGWDKAGAALGILIPFGSYKSLNRLFGEIDAAVDAAESGRLIQFSDEGGALTGTVRDNQSADIWFQDKINVPGAGPGGANVQLRTHSPNPNAVGHASEQTYTTQINSGSQRLVPNELSPGGGDWKTPGQMSDSDWAAHHMNADKVK